MPGVKRWVRLLAAAAVMPLLIGAADFVIGRPDRIRAARRRDDLLDVRDQILRFEFEHGRLPSSLGELVPRYLQKEQLERGGRPLYVYLPSRRLIREAEGSFVRGLPGYRLPPFALPLPEPECKRFPPAPAGAPGEERAGGTAPSFSSSVSPSREDAASARKTPPRAAERPEEPLPEPAGVLQGEGSGKAAVENPAPQLPPDLFESGAAFVPEGPDAPDALKGSIVFEAENFSEMNYGWVVRPDKNCSGGAYLHAREGVANGPGQTRYKVGDFYNLHDNRDVTFLRYYIHVPKTGRYYAYARMWTTDTHCSNYLAAAFDRGGPYVGGVGNRTPFRWVWSKVEGSPVKLKEGDHFLHIFIHEDGVKIDQFILTPFPLEGGEMRMPNYLPGEGTAWRSGNGPKVKLLFDLEAMVMTEKRPPEGRLAIRRMRPVEGKGRLRVVLHGAGGGGKDVVVADYSVDLGRLPEVCFVNLDFDGVDVTALPRKEFLLSARLEQEGRVVAETGLPMMRPFAWEVFGPGRFIPVDSEGPLDGNKEWKKGMKGVWRPVIDGAWTYFGVLDFGLQFAGNSKHAPMNRTVYARTKIVVPETGEYLFKVQSDDQMLLWLDGGLLIRNPAMRPVTRVAIRRKVRLEKGTHVLKMRVNQVKGPWQATLRIRTPDDDISGVRGGPPPEHVP